MLTDIVKWSSEAIPKGKKVTEFRKLLGIMFSLTRTTKRRQDLWSSEDFIFPAPNFGLRFGISRNCLNDLLHYLRFCPADEYTNKEDKWSPVRRLIKEDKWSPVRRLIKGFNSHLWGG